VEPRRAAFLVNHSQRSEQGLKVISRPQLVLVEMLVIWSRGHILEASHFIPGWRD